MQLKKIIFLFSFFISGVCATANPIFVFSDSVVPVKADTARLLADLTFLAGSPVARDDAHAGRLNECADYIFHSFNRLTDSVEFQKYLLNGKEYRNVICSFGPRSGPRVIIGAHYDVCGSQPGADDNASGVAGLLELARLLKVQEAQLHYRVDLVAYTLEEPPNFRTANMGSAVHAKMLSEQHIPVKEMICLEMIGYYSDRRGSQHYPAGLMKLFYPSRADYIAVVGKNGQGRAVRRTKKAMRGNSAIRVCSINAPAFIPGIDFSDHLNYWKYGYTAVMITDTSFYRNNNYHERTDTLDTLNPGKMAEVVNGVLAAVMGL